MKTQTITTAQGDTVDLLCRRHYGDESGYTERVLLANPGLAALGAVLPLGTRVVLPEQERRDTEQRVVSLWS